MSRSFYIFFSSSLLCILFCTNYTNIRRFLIPPAHNIQHSRIAIPASISVFIDVSNRYRYVCVMLPPHTFLHHRGIFISVSQPPPEIQKRDLHFIRLYLCGILVQLEFIKRKHFAFSFSRNEKNEMKKKNSRCNRDKWAINDSIFGTVKAKQKHDRNRHNVSKVWQISVFIAITQ